MYADTGTYPGLCLGGGGVYMFIGGGPLGGLGGMEFPQGTFFLNKVQNGEF